MKKNPEKCEGCNAEATHQLKRGSKVLKSYCTKCLAGIGGSLAAMEEIGITWSRIGASR